MQPALYQALATFCVGLGTLSLSAFIAVYGHKIQRRDKDNAWIQVFRDLYSKFWSDEHMARVRAWLACDAWYQEIEPILIKRLTLGRVEAKEYETLESIDKFCALMMQMLQMIPRSVEQERLYRQLIDRYWLQRLRERQPFREYVRLFWPLFGEVLNKVPDEKIPFDIVAVSQSLSTKSQSEREYRMHEIQDESLQGDNDVDEIPPRDLSEAPNPSAAPDANRAMRGRHR